MMAEEQKAEVKQEQKAVDENPAMKKALSGGWRPQEEWDGNPEDWVDYREFNVRGELMGRIQEQSGILNNYKSQIEEQRQALKDLAAMQDKIAEREYNKIMKQLRTAKAEAIENSDGETVTAIDDEIDKLKAQREETKVKQTQEAKKQEVDGTPPEVQAWLSNSRNSWYTTDKFLQGVANTLAAQIVNENPNMSPSDVLKRMDTTIRQEMPHKFSQTPAVDDGGGDGANRAANGRGKKRSFNDLTPEEQEAARRFEKLEVMSVEEYIEQLDAV